jgi:hypothetical protein
MTSRTNSKNGMNVPRLEILLSVDRSIDFNCDNNWHNSWLFMVAIFSFNRTRNGHDITFQKLTMLTISN